MKKLWEVSVEATLYVLADTEQDAVDIAESNATRADFPDTVAREISAGWKLPTEALESIPYGKDTDNTTEWERTVGDILVGMKAQVASLTDNVDVVRDLLSLVLTRTPAHAVVAAWSTAQREEASKWAAADYLSASDNDDVVVLPIPAFLVEFV